MKMDRICLEEATFEKQDYSLTALAKGDYEHCTFNQCHFSEADLSDVNFSNCVFAGCNLCSAKIDGTSFNEVAFKGCKMLGLDFGSCNDLLFSVSFEDCILNFSLFGKLKMKGTRFTNTSLQEVDFRQTDLASSVFANCDLKRTLFEKTNLEKADFRTAFNYSFVPEANRLKKARFSLPGVLGLLDHLGIAID